MAINATNESTGSNFEPVPAGNHIARCYQIIHIGTVTESIPGKGSKTLNKVYFKFELCNKRKEFKPGEGEKPMSIGKEFTLSMNEKANLRKALESWRGKAFTEEQAKSFDVTKVMGKACMVNIIHKTSGAGKVYEDITSITPIPEGVTAPPIFNQTFEFNYTPFIEAQFNKIPAWIQKKMKESHEYKVATGIIKPLTPEQEAALHGQEHEKRLAAERKGPNDDLPF